MSGASFVHWTTNERQINYGRMCTTRNRRQTSAKQNTKADTEATWLSTATRKHLGQELCSESALRQSNGALVGPEVEAAVR